MIRVNRSEPCPPSLLTAATLQQAQAAEVYYNTWVAGQAAFVEFTRYKENDVQQALRKMFAWKCAYCERQLEKGSFEVEHYRPKGGVEGCDHPGYWWLALEWTNLLPTCAACNKGLLQHVVNADMELAEVEALQSKRPTDLHGKRTQFPVLLPRLTAKSNDHFAEGPLLIDPTNTDPEPELQWRSDCVFSIVEPAATATGPSAMGIATIKCVALNRIDLVENRTQVLERLRTQRIQIMDTLEKAVVGADDATINAAIQVALLRIGDMKLSCNANQPYAGMARAFVRSFASGFETWAVERQINAN
jgi:hypothetical protein